MCSSPLPMHLRGQRDDQRDAPPASARQEEQKPARQQHVTTPARGGDSSSVAAQRWPGEQRRRHNLRGGGDGSGGGKQVAKQEEQKRRGGQSLAAVTALGTVAVYASARCGISLFHHARRHFLTQLLHDLAAALDGLGATWWLDFGSLLGVYRDGQLILHDNDIDLAVWRPDWGALLEGLRAALPQYRMRLVVPSEDPSTQFLRVYCPLGMADVFGAAPAAHGRVLVDCGHGSCTEVDHAAVLPTGTMTWRGSNICIPGNVPLALEQRYGADWRVPRYMDKGADVVEGQKLYARIFRALSSLGIRI